VASLFSFVPRSLVCFLFSLSKLVAFVFVAFLSSSKEAPTRPDPTRPASCAPSRYSTLGSGSGGMDMALFPSISTPRGIAYCFYNPRFIFFFVNISQCPTGGVNGSLLFLQSNPSLASVSLLFLCPDSGYQSPSSSSACLCWRGCGADTHNKAKAGSAWLEM